VDDRACADDAIEFGGGFCFDKRELIFAGLNE
jgi:hypothetical protein